MMKFLPTLLAAVTGPLERNTPAFDPTASDARTNNLFTSQTRDLFLICGAALAMALVLFLWVYLTRKDRQKEMASARGARMLVPPEPRSSERRGRKVRVRKRRADHPDNLGRNPTLAEAGGLPPLRPDEPEPPPEDSAQPPPYRPEAQT
jgi:hypothetical protein